MEKLSPRQAFRARHIGFVSVVLLSYFSAILTIGYVQIPFTPRRIIILVSASLLYFIIGIAGFAFVRRQASLLYMLGYFAIQLGLAGLIIGTLPSSFLWYMMLPLVGQSVVLLPLRWTLVVCTAALLTRAVPVYMGGGLFAAFVVGFIFLAATAFVVVFAQIAVNEQKARAEVERLASQLQEANDKLRHYALQVEELATAKERNRLAREIHDSLGHYLTVVNVQLEAALALLDVDSGRTRDVLLKAQSLTQEGLTEVRRSVAALRIVPTDNRSLTETLDTLVEESRAAGIPTQLLIEGTPRQLSPQAELTLYRAAQEGLTNIRKHAHARNAKLVLDYTESAKVKLIVEDDGIGSALNNDGFGLLGVRERTQILGGAMRTRAVTNEGFALEVELNE